MLISEILKNNPDNDVISLQGEKDFERFSRTTSAIDTPCCVYIASERYINTIPNCARMVITTEEISNKIDKEKYGLCISKNPKATYFRLFVAASELINSNNSETKIGDNCIIGKYANISPKNVVIGNNVIIEDFATVYENAIIQDNCVIRAGARIGVQDYNYFEDEKGLIHLPHYGDLQIEEDVEIGFNSVIGRSLYPGDHTIIGRGSKIANHCAIGHDCVLGERVMIYANTMVAGFCSIGNDTHITMNVCIKNGIKIGKNVQIDMGSVIIRDVPDGYTMFGNPARRIITPGM